MMRIVNYLRRKTDRVGLDKNSIKAQGMVEFALVLPILLLLILGIIEFGRLVFIYSSVSASSREAARYGASTESVGVNTYRYSDCDGIIAAAQRVGVLAGIDAGDITIHYDDGTNVVEPNCHPAVSVNRGERIVVSVTSDYSTLVPLVNIPPIPITSTTARTIIKNVGIKGTPKPTDTPSPSPIPTDTPNSGCPEVIYFNRQGIKKLKFGISNPTGSGVVLTDIVLTWSGGGGDLKSISFMEFYWSGSASPNMFVYSGSDSISGFTQQDMIFTFANNSISGLYSVSVTFEGCNTIQKTYTE